MLLEKYKVEVMKIEWKGWEGMEVPCGEDRGVFKVLNNF